MPDFASERPWTRLRNAGRKVAKAYALKLRRAPEAMIHQRVGMRRTLHIEEGTRGARCISLAPRSGSLRRSKAGTSRSAGTAAKTIAARQPYAWASGPLKK